MALTIGPLANCGLFFSLVCVMFVSDQTLVEHLYCDKGLLATLLGWEKKGKNYENRQLCPCKSKCRFFSPSVRGGWKGGQEEKRGKERRTCSSSWEQRREREGTGGWERR